MGHHKDEPRADLRNPKDNPGGPRNRMGNIKWIIHR